MPYPNEFAGYRPLQRIAETERVKQLLRRSRTLDSSTATVMLTPVVILGGDEEPLLPDFVVAIDGSPAEVDVRNGYPGAKVEYCTVASVLLNLSEIDRLDVDRPIDPRAFRDTEEAATIDAALPGSNVVSRTHNSARDSFREALYEVLHDVVVDAEERTTLLDTFEALLALKPLARPQICPYGPEGCEEHFNIGAGVTSITT